MPPGLSQLDERNERLANAIGVCHKLLGSAPRTKLSDLTDLRFCEPSPTVSPTPKAMLPIPKHLVIHVVSMSANRQMGWIYAWWIVAGVANLKAIWNRADVQFIADAMGVLVGSSDLETPVTLAPQSCRPGPAFVWVADVNLGPEPFLKSAHQSSESASFIDL